MDLREVPKMSPRKAGVIPSAARNLLRHAPSQRRSFAALRMTAIPRLDLVAFLFERLVDPAAVDRARLDLLHRVGLLRQYRPGRVEDGLGVLLRHYDQAVGVADDDVARVDGYAPHDDRHVDLAGSVLVGTAVRDAACVDGEAPLAQLGGVAD